MADPPPKTKKRILVIQWRGDYREAYLRFAAGGEENYYAQRITVMEADRDMAQEHDAYAVMCLGGTPRFEELMPNGVTAMSAGSDSDKVNYTAVSELMAAFRPSHLILSTPDYKILSEAVAKGINVLPLFADTLLAATQGLSVPRRLVKKVGHYLRVRRLARILNDRRIRFVGNHNVNACLHLVQNGVIADKVIPWDWPPVVRPDDFPPKQLAADARAWNLTFVGSMVPEKGPGDVIQALAELRRRGRSAHARSLAGAISSRSE